MTLRMTFSALLPLAAVLASTSGAMAATFTLSDNSGISIDSSGTITQADTAPTAAGAVTAVTVEVRGLTSTWSQDLVLSIISPEGTVVSLMNGLFSSGDWTGQTLVFDDDAATDITASGAGIGGTFQPQGSLSALAGEAAAGDWTFGFTDQFAGDASGLTGWTITLTTDAEEPEPEAEVPVPAALPLALALGGLGALALVRSRRRKG